MTAEEKKERKRALYRERYANDPVFRAKQQARGRANIPKRNEKRKVVLRQKAAEDGRLLKHRKTIQQQAEDAIMAEYEAERKTIARIERRACWSKHSIIGNALACARLKKAWYSMTPAERRAKTKEKLSKVPKERLAEYRRRYYERLKTERPEEWKEMRMKYKARKTKRPKSAHTRAKENLRNRFKEQMKRYRTTGIDSFSSLLGCSKSFFATWIEKQFVRGMKWDNYGTAWHIDHIIPLAAFELMDESDIRKAWHYTNLRPLWAIENIQKGDSIITHQPELILYLQ